MRKHIHIIGSVLAVIGVACLVGALQVYLTLPWTRPASYVAAPAPEVRAQVAWQVGTSSVIQTFTQVLYVEACPYTVRCMDVTCHVSLDVGKVLDDGGDLGGCNRKSLKDVMSLIISGKATNE